jgi:SAM-dependent methyltransferase
MSAKDRVRWDEIFANRKQDSYPTPAALLLQFTPAVAEDEQPNALDLAAGLGQNGLWLAEQGYHVDVMDISRVALRQAREEMALRNLRNANLLQVDLDELVLKHDGDCLAAHEICAESYDLICVFRYLKRSLFPLIKDAIKPNGRVIYETFNLNYLQEVPQFNRDFLLKQHELADIFSDWRIIHHEEESSSTQLVAVKPGMSF